MKNQNWIDPEGVDSRGWTRSHRETETSGPEGIKRTAYGTDFSNPQGQYEYQEWNGQRTPFGENSGQWPEQKDYKTSSPDTISTSNRPQDKHINSQTQQAESLDQEKRKLGGDNETDTAPADSSSSARTALPPEWDANEQGSELREDGQYDENSESKFGNQTRDPRV